MPDTTTRGTWTDQAAGPYDRPDIRPPTQRFRSPKLPFYTVAVAPVLSPDLSKFGNDYGNVPRAFTVDADTFNREVGWVVSAWHWSVVKSGGVVGAGDVPTAEMARQAAESTVRLSLGRKRSVIDAVWPATYTLEVEGR